jgi:hypothetical protein
VIRAEIIEADQFNWSAGLGLARVRLAKRM